jgi:hypothetical protein
MFSHIHKNWKMGCPVIKSRRTALGQPSLEQNDRFRAPGPEADRRKATLRRHAEMGKPRPLSAINRTGN